MTIKKLKKKTPVYLNNFSDKKDVASSFSTTLDDVNILFATYGTDNYSGDAFVLFEKGGKLFEVNGSHCSCYGLEDQWQPEETTLEALKHRLVEGKMGQDNWSGNVFSSELIQFLEI